MKIPADWKDCGKELPPVGETIDYLTDHYRFMGFVDDQGRWHDHTGRLEVRPVIAWAPLAGCSKGRI